MKTDYAGATALLAPEAGLSLPSARWAWQPKIDGVYARVSTDQHGRISNILARSGRPHSLADVDGLVGLATGLPGAVLLGELEASTEAGVRARETRGWAALHLFDVARVAGTSTASRPYHERYAQLHRWQAAVENDGRVPRETWWSIDEFTYAHDMRGGRNQGRFVTPRPSDLRRLPIVPLSRGPSAGEQLWLSYVELGGGEGLVACRLDAPLGARASKRKVKRADTIDAVCLKTDTSCALLDWKGMVFAVPASGWLKRGLAPGMVVEVRCDAYYESGIPRFARITRIRHDKVAA